MIIYILTTGANTLLALVQLALCGGGCMCWLCTHFLNDRYIETERVVVSHPDITHELEKTTGPFQERCAITDAGKGLAPRD